MDSEIIVVLVLIAIAVGFILWVRTQSHPHETAPPSDQVEQQRRSAKKS